jgi:hypothetical protein
MEFVPQEFKPQLFAISAANMWYFSSSPNATEPPQLVVLLKMEGGGYAGMTGEGATSKREQSSPSQGMSQMQEP